MEESISLALIPEEKNGAIVLAESFRMTRTPLAAINSLFRDLMHDGDTPYSELVQGRESNNLGRVEWICPPVPKAGKELVSDNSNDEEIALGQDYESNETALISRKIQSIVQNDDPTCYIEENGRLRRPRYSDIAILLRSRGSLRSLERSLNEAHIPYLVSKGSGFFSQARRFSIL